MNTLNAWLNKRSCAWMQETKELVWPLAMGALFFFVITGGAPLNPSNIHWLIQNDPLTSWLGWDFFRQTPYWQWPIGANWNYGMELGSSIVFTDSIPLLALVFKPITHILPTPFQYFGIWILACFILQTLFAQKLLQLYLSDPWVVRIASLFFSIAPIFLWRLHGHYALCGQWVILAALYLYLSKESHTGRWLTILCLSALIQAYLLLMVLVIWGAYQLQCCLAKRASRKNQALSMITTLVFLGAVMWAAGYFMLSSGKSSWGFGFYRMNLLSLIDPDDMWSYLLPNRFSAPGDYEGFNYLGLGALGLLLFALALFFRKPKIDFAQHVWILVITCTGLFLYAISSHVALGHYELFSYEVRPFWLNAVANTFRNSGRFFWPVYYLIYLAALVLVCRSVKRSTALTICSLCLLVQIADSSRAWSYFYEKYHSASHTQAPSQHWATLVAPYKQMLVVLPRNQSPHWQLIAQVAAQNQKAVNVGYFARINQLQEEQARKDLALQILENRLPANSLYLFEDKALWQVALDNRKPEDLIGQIDGIYFLAPRFHLLSQESSTLDALLIRPQTAITYSIGQTIDFSKSGKGVTYQAYGWADPEDLGTWTNGHDALLLLKLSKPISTPLAMTITADAFHASTHTEQEVTILVNQVEAGKLHFSQGQDILATRLPIPEQIIAQHPSTLAIELTIANPQSPSNLGLSDDSRQLGLRLKSIKIDQP